MPAVPFRITDPAFPVYPGDGSAAWAIASTLLNVTTGLLIVITLASLAYLTLQAQGSAVARTAKQSVALILVSCVMLTGSMFVAEEADTRFATERKVLHSWLTTHYPQLGFTTSEAGLLLKMHTVEVDGQHWQLEDADHPDINGQFLKRVEE